MIVHVIHFLLNALSEVSVKKSHNVLLRSTIAMANLKQDRFQLHLCHWFLASFLNLTLDSAVAVAAHGVGRGLRGWLREFDTRLGHLS